MTILAPRPTTSDTALPVVRSWRGVRELGFIALMYAAYAASRVFADDSLAPARDRALRILSIEDNLLLDVERDVVDWFLHSDVAGLLAAYYYAGAHYIVTAVVLLWLYRRRAALYPQARQVLVGSTLVALVGYLLMPTAPPRLVGYADLMALHADSGWWGEAASAPQGMGWMTNQLAAFPSMHAGWALWVALAVMAATTNRTLRAAGWAHAVLTAVVVVGTGNHWLLDVVVGWALVALVWKVAEQQPSSLGNENGLASESDPDLVPQPRASIERSEQELGRLSPQRAERAPSAPAPDRSSSTSAAARP